MTRTLLAGVAALIGACGLISAAQASGAAPQLNGKPPPTVTVGTFYKFMPYAADAEGDTLTFSIASKPSWAYFNPRTGRLFGTPPAAAAGIHEQIAISVTDGTSTRTLPTFAITVQRAATPPPPPVAPRKASYGHYFATRYQDTPDDVAMLCEQHGIEGVMIRRAWSQLEPSAGSYDWRFIDDTLQAVATSRNPQCQLWVMPEFKSFASSPVKNPCPAYLQGRYSALNADVKSSSCFMWEPAVGNAYVALMRAMAARYDANPRFEGFVLQESALSFSGDYSQDVAAGGTYTAVGWRDALVRYVGACGNAFKQSRCMVFMNFIRGGQQYLHDVSEAISAVPENRACLSGPDLLPDQAELYKGHSSAYEVLARHEGCRSNSAQNNSFKIHRFGLDQVFNFATRGTLGDFDETSPRQSGVCVNSYLFWNHRVGTGWTGLNWYDVLPVVAAYPYGRMWLDQCAGGGGAP